MEKDRKKTKFVHQPEYPGGPKAITQFIYQHLKYPQAALEANIEGVVFIEYDIDHQGNVTATKILKSLGHGCDEEACRVVKMLKFDVQKTRGLNVLFHQKIKVQFKKPKVQPPAPAQQMQLNYTITSSETSSQPAPAEPTTTGQQVYTYTIKIG